MGIKATIEQSIKVKQMLLADAALQSRIGHAAEACVQSLRQGGKILLCGNGGSAADAQHIAAELSGRYLYDRPPLFAEALHVNGSFVTAVANDYSYNEVFSRMVEAMGRKNDVLIALSTSGNSPNILKAIEKANKLGLVVIGLTGLSGGAMNSLCSYLINIPSNNTARVQESHILVGHILCEIIEKEMFPIKND